MRKSFGYPQSARRSPVDTSDRAEGRLSEKCFLIQLEVLNAGTGQYCEIQVLVY